ncbi:G1 family glutamic endopeptidase [Plastoroseomonas arctica]|uniref:Uncharacterized protein n=1 Tax=Plastoroseomonas arctica TaxID=1509237 RepID=A0AAF1JY26_9PROT|nr:G1 family glutamic endopeptidase [Plastoroseomonas arctica]MBR0654668.1 hypothetical protein [Plastoroseomonas arctica]
MTEPDAGGGNGPTLPPAGFDPVNIATDRDRLAEFGLPPAPDAAKDPALFAHWSSLFGPDTAFVPADTRPASPAERLFRAMKSMALRRVGARPASRLSLSGNWSGGWIAANRSERFRAVAARWQVPSVAIGAPEDANGEPYRCSIWVGLDGKHRWAASMPQLGTEHTAGPDGGHRFWWQWWVRGSTDLQHYVDGLPLAAGDQVLCYLAMLSTTRVVFCFANLSQGKTAFATVAKSAAPMRGSTAEWILERPANGEVVGNEVITGNLFPMPDFGLVTSADFAASCVRLNDPSVARPRFLRPCRMIQNGTVRAAPVRIAVTARTERYRERDLRIRYQRPK